MKKIFNYIKLPPKKNYSQIIKYFKKYDLLKFLKDPIISKKRNINKIINPWSSKTYSPELIDFYMLHAYIILNKRMTILEFGSGWSSLILAHALMLNKKKYTKHVKRIRKKNIFELHILENEKKFLEITKKRNNKFLKGFNKISYHLSDCQMTTYNGQFCTEYKKLPLVNPDFIYLDGPDQFKIKKRINNFTTSHEDMMPMVCDILKFENFLIPGTIIIADGRKANSSFLLNNFKRNWLYFYDESNDQSIFYLNDKSLGPINNEILKFYKNK